MTSEFLMKFFRRLHSSARQNCRPCDRHRIYDEQRSVSALCDVSSQTSPRRYHTRSLQFE